MRRERHFVKLKKSDDVLGLFYAEKVLNRLGKPI